MEYRVEHDSMGEVRVPADKYWGAQTERSRNNFPIGVGLETMPREIVHAFGILKKAAAMANHALKPEKMTEEKLTVISQAADEVISGALADNFPLVVWQTGSGTQSNMNANEVIANRALELMGYEKGDYQHCWPNDHCNCGQSTNDVYPTTIRLTFIEMNKQLVAALERLVASFRKKGEEFKNNIKMGRTQLQDAVPMTSGQEFTAFANTLEEEIGNLNRNVELMLEINMGATAIGTGLNAVPGYAELCTKKLAELTGENFTLGKDLVEATPDTGDYVSYSGALKRLAVKLSKICNDLRLMASGPRCGLHEINLPPMAPGSSIMPGKVNPVIPEVTNQTCFKVIGNDTTVMIAAEAGQLQLNVMEPVITQCIIESQTWLGRAMDTLRERCVDGITVNAEHNAETVRNSIGIVTALNPYIGYKNSTKIAKEALETGASVYDLVLRDKILTKEKLDAILDPKHMLDPEDVIK